MSICTTEGDRAVKTTSSIRCPPADTEKIINDLAIAGVQSWYKIRLLDARKDKNNKQRYQNTNLLNFLEY